MMIKHCPLTTARLGVALQKKYVVLFIRIPTKLQNFTLWKDLSTMLLTNPRILICCSVIASFFFWFAIDISNDMDANSVSLVMLSIKSAYV